MIVFTLSCSQQHRFDGWFRSADDFAKQHAKHMVECPICGDHAIEKELSAPRINVGAMETSVSNESKDGAAVNPPQEVVTSSMMPQLQEHMMKQFKQFIVANTENVGSAFAETARKMHYGEENHRNIRGRVSPEESQALRDEGIETVGLPQGIMLDEGVQ
jgi:hypothetical protein